jgi:hypothetical protein
MLDRSVKEDRRFLDDSCPVDLLVLPGVASKLGDLAEATCGAAFLSNMVGVSATSPASDVSSLSAGLT